MTSSQEERFAAALARIADDAETIAHLTVFAFALQRGEHALVRSLQELADTLCGRTASQSS